jgi:hypothetical protein
MRRETREVFITDDGKEFLNEEAALKHTRRAAIRNVLGEMCINTEDMSTEELIDEFLKYREPLIEALGG